MAVSLWMDCVQNSNKRQKYTQWRFTHNLRQKKKRTGIMSPTLGFCVWANLFIFVVNFVCEAEQRDLMWIEWKSHGNQANDIRGKCDCTIRHWMEKVLSVSGHKTNDTENRFLYLYPALSYRVWRTSKHDSHVNRKSYFITLSQTKRKRKLFNRWFSLLYWAHSMNSIGFIISRGTTIQAKS